MTLLTETRPTLPGSWYYDPEHYGHELEAIWYRDWVCVGRLDDIPSPGDYVVVSIGNQRLVVTRNAESDIRAFHNTCRHRGSEICGDGSGRFHNGRIICPYHTWTYSLDGELVATPTRIKCDDFQLRDYSLYAAHVDTWGGYIFVNLSDEPSDTLAQFLSPEADALRNWPLANMESVHQERSSLACNWKVFWENYSECYHCPRIHPELCRIVPLYKKGLLNNCDETDWKPDFDNDDGRPRVGAGRDTWTLDGQSSLPQIDGLTETERTIGMSFASFTASMYVVAHSDYVRSVRLLPTGAESVELVVDWLLMPGVKEAHAEKLEKVFELGRLVVRQDGEVCELNQRGLRCLRHERGVLVPQEYSLWEFHEWLRGRLSGLLPDTA